MKRLLLILNVGFFAALIAPYQALAEHPDRDLRDRVYERICTDAIRAVVKQPSSMEITSTIVGPPTPLSREAYLEGVDHEALRSALARAWEENRPQEVAVGLEFSGGGSESPILGYGISICRFWENANAGVGDDLPELKAVNLNGEPVGPGTIGWLTRSRPVGIDITNRVQIGWRDRLSAFFASDKDDR